MEQYELRPSKYYDMLIWALEKHTAEKIYIRLVGSRGGAVKINENLYGRRLSLKRSLKRLAGYHRRQRSISVSDNIRSQRFTTLRQVLGNCVLPIG